MPSRSRIGFVVGLLAFAIGLVGYVVLGWRFVGSSDPIPTALGVVAAVIAVLVTVLNRV